MGGSPSRSSDTAVHRDTYGGARSSGATDYSVSAHVISGGAIGAASAFTVTTPFVAPTTMELPTATATTTTVMQATAMAAVGANIWHQRLGHPNERAEYGSTG